MAQIMAQITAPIVIAQGGAMAFEAKPSHQADNSPTFDVSKSRTDFDHICWQHYHYVRHRLSGRKMM
ncbi:25165_t:CDS:2 [Cetraspora pellucida]|uniref:25165_t:CDS:1 n=1 Tax=Cetraspora pellucida TaxID=1433469 RepID=A0A9N9A1S8_9GLOM|nr:25165_t:CDS:2 [Cetraspora pellucida]